MNREIKFRIIHNNIVSGYERLSETGWEWMWLELNPDSGERWTRGIAGGSLELIRNQFTGLHDKNGKEIYEGDILHCHEWDSSDCGHRIVQTFKNAVVGFGQGNYYYYPKGNMQQPHQLLMYAHKPEIIGNIYEHPTLLTHAQ